MKHSTDSRSPSSRARWALAVVGVLGALVELGWERAHASSAPMAASAPSSCATGTACAAPSLEARGEGERAEVPRGKPRLLEFESEHCAACAKMSTIVSDVAARCTKDDDTVLRIRIDDPSGEALAAHYGVRSLPTFVNVDASGAEVTRAIGVQGRAEIGKMVAEVRGEACSAAM